jgi:DMSO/TMAO reductase YedYZ molybdopterin-dependent catalytic subunit
MESPAANRRVAFRGVNRRDFVRRVVAAGAVVTAGLDRPAASQSPPAPPGAPVLDDPTKVLGAPVRPYGERSRFEKSARAVAGTPTLYASFSRTPLQDSHGIITPSSLHFERHHGGVPDIDPRRHRLLIHGMVDRPLVLTMDEIRRLPTVSRIYFLECGGNTAGEWDHPRGKDVQTTHGLMGCSEWTGVPLSLLLREVGVRPGASWILAEGTLNTNAALKTVGSYWPHATTVWDYIRRAMPFQEPGSLTHDEVYEVTAYLLYLNGIIAEHDVIDARTLPQVIMPNRDGFIPDPRPTPR